MKKTNKSREIKDYDDFDATEMIDQSKPLSLEDLGLKLPDTPPTQVVSIRLPSQLLNQIKAYSSQMDIPYQALIKMILSKSMEEEQDKVA